MSAPEHVSAARQRGQRRRDIREHGRPAQPGSFRVRADTDPEYRVSLDVSYTDQATADAIRKDLTEVYGLAVAEIGKRFSA